MANDHTAGELRAILQTSKAAWRIDDRLADGQVAQRHATGVDLALAVKSASVPRIAITPYLSELTANPFLRRRRIDRGFLKPDALPQQIRTFELPVRGRAQFDTAADTAVLNVSGRAVTPLVIDVPTPAAPSAGSGRATSVDWRNRFGWPWLTQIKDQDPCESCWCFGATGVVEAMTRIEHAVWSLRSEGDVHDGMGAKCADGGWPSHALDWMKAHGGVADAGCWAYETTNAAYAPTSDRSGRSVRLDDYVALSTVEDQKSWLDAVGPITACFTCYDDFFGYGPNSGVYTANPNSGVAGGHCIVVVGYDDAKNAWLIRNSWGTGWGMAGYCWLGYGQANVDDNVKYGVAASAVNPDPWTKRRAHAGSLMESGNGPNHRNFEMWTSAPGGAIRHGWREGYGALAWHVAETQANDCVGDPTVAATTYNRNFEMIHRTTANRLHHRFYDQAMGAWRDGPTFGPTNVAGPPAFLQGDFGAPGNFEVVVGLADGTLQHWWRNAGTFAWQASATFGSGVASSAPAMIQRRDRTLELVVANKDGTMQRWTRDSRGVWAAFEKFGSGVRTAPVMLEGQFAAPSETAEGNYELVVAVGGTVQHWWKSNVGGAGAWSMSASFGTNAARVSGMLEGSFGFDLEVVVELTDGSLQHFWRNGAWHAGPIVGSLR